MYKFLTIAMVGLVLANAGPAVAKKAKPSPAPSGATTSGTMPTCASGDPVVWENLSGSKVYHLQGDKYFGKTKKGSYACKSAADSAGFHASGSTTSSKSSKSSKKSASPQPGGMGASPNAGSVPTPAST